jgi:hypothetical protein
VIVFLIVSVNELASNTAVICLFNILLVWFFHAMGLQAVEPTPAGGTFYFTESQYFLVNVITNYIL